MLNPRTFVSGVIGVLFIVGTNPLFGMGERISDKLARAYREHTPIPLTSQHQETLTVDSAYGIQKDVVQILSSHNPISGFKAGLTSKTAQKRFNVSEPLSGVLLKSGITPNLAQIDIATFSLGMIESEIGFNLNTTITEPIQSIDQLKPLVESVWPIIELPDLGYINLEKLTGNDIIAANVSARLYIVGDTPIPEYIDINTIQVDTFFNGKLVNKGIGSDAMGDQWQAALWLINTIVEQGYTISPDHILITGALGRMLPGAAGQYRIEFADTNVIQFTLQ